MSGISYAPPSPLAPWPEFNSLQWILLNSSVTKNYVDSTFLMLSGGTMTGGINAININMSGNLVSSGNIQLTNAGSSISTIGTLSIPTSSFYINSTLVTSSASELNYLHGVTPGTATASNAIVLDASSNITSIGTIGQTVAAGGDMLVLTSSATAARNTIKFVTDNQSWEIGSRGSTASNPTNFYVYNGAYKLLMNPTGDTSILSSTDSTSATTGCLKLTGGLGVVKNIYCTGILTLDRNGSNLTINNGANSALIELSSSPINLRMARGYALSVGGSGVSIVSSGTRDPVCPLDMGQTASNMIVSLYNNTASYYGFSANNSSTQYSSGGGHVFYSSCTNASPINTKVLGISSTGRVELVNNGYIGNAAYNNMLYLASSGTVLINSSTVSNTSNWLEITGNTYNTGYSGWGINNPTFPIHVTNSGTTSISSYGYVSITGTTGLIPGSSGNFACAAKFADRIVSGEHNLVSDRRIKKDITDITEEEALAFLSINPIHYILKKCGTPSYGYIAQEIMKCQALKHNKYILDDIINICPEPGIKEEIDEDGFLNPADSIFTVNYAKCVPLLHKIIKMQESKIQELSNALQVFVGNDIASLRDEITSLREELSAVTGASTPPKKPKKPKSVL